MNYENAGYATKAMNQLSQGPQVQQPQYGISSGYKDLTAAVEQIVNTVDNLRSSLGISVPKADSANSNESATLATQLRQLSRMLGSANGDLTEVLMHLNS